MQVGVPWPLGATLDATGLNVAVWAPDATQLWLCLFDDQGHTETRRLALPACTNGVWHGHLAREDGGVAGLVYGLRAQGPWAPQRGQRFNPAKVLFDPWGREAVGSYSRTNVAELEMFRGDDPRDNAAVAVKARVLAMGPSTGSGRTEAVKPASAAHRVIAEVHVRSASRLHPEVPAELQGSYAGLSHPALIRHWQALGITTLSLLPIQLRADEERLQRLGLSNHWGYSTLGYFAPEPRYWSGRAGTSPTQECRAMVEALHRAGLEVILDVVGNHSAETDEDGPTLSWRGLSNARSYRLEAQDPARYVNWAGCGNVFDFSQPRVVEHFIAALRYWVEAIGVDGFRFDLAPILARDRHGQFDAGAPLLAALQADPVLARVVWIAEPWDPAPGGYQLGRFPAGWLEWNDRFRDTMRAFWLHQGRAGDAVSRGDFVHRFAASSTEFCHDGRAPSASVNFITAHDGFTLRDLLSFEERHNEANGEHNRDGHGHNLGWHCGVEGPSADPAVLALRLTLSRALLATLLLAQGTPMLLMGDELGHSQQGNNNAYCQDNALSWLTWAADNADNEDSLSRDLCATVARLLRLRQQTPALQMDRWWTPADVTWLEPDGVPISAAAWGDVARRALAVWLHPPGLSAVMILINAADRPCCFHRPEAASAQAWRWVFASDQPGGESMLRADPGSTMLVPARSVLVAAPIPENPEETR
ncbi:MAG: glycogen debranching protein GlgX [Leptothrix ochracea]|uniref:glycogen debranching protein GlgX n=1 Tax=Leptothrix ochracea TaxID=735331 RepID=UPI0034E2A194